MYEALQQALAEQKQRHRYRVRRISDGPQGPIMQVNGKQVLSFCSNDYLGLANDPRIVQALQKGAEQYGVGSGAAHLVNGHSSAHHALEDELADFTGRPRALLFSTGYMANLGVIGALSSRSTIVYEDRLNHASLIDAAHLAQVRLKRYSHADTQTLQQWLSSSHDSIPIVATDGVFSMDGDIAPLAELADLTRQHKAWLLVDDAHGLGVLCERGQGSAAMQGLGTDQVPILMGTLGKAFGTFGAFIAGEEALIETLIQQARSYIYTTALPPAIAEATRASLRIVREESWRRDKLQTLIKRFRAGAEQLGLALMPSATPIQPLLFGEDAAALKASQQLLAQDILVTAIRPPTVPEGSARLRITLSAAHEAQHIDRLLEALGQCQ